jgi:lipopolysaccharide transport system ATP-binding protein
MNARLGFSIAAHLEPEVLLIDEVLSVGDMAFQQRCLDRMLRFRRDGVALVFVSHNLQAVAQLCDTVLHLERQVRAIGPAHDVIEHYVLSSAGAQAASSSAGADVDILDAVLVDARGRRATALEPNADVTLRVTFGPRTDETDLTFGVVVHRSTDGLVVYDVNFDAADIGADRIRAGRTFTIDFGLRANLTRGHYHVETHVCHNPTQRFSRRCPAATFAVSEQRTFGGVADLQASALMVTQ